MALADIAARLNEGPPWQTCQVCHALETLNTADAQALRDMLSRPNVRYTVISELVANDPDTPLNLHPDALARHAKGRCSAKEKLR